MRCYRLAILGSFSLFMGLWGLTAQPALGQLSATGLDQFGTFQRTPIQTMNLASLNNHIEIDLFSKKERGNAFDAKLVWDLGDSLSLVYGYGVPPSCCFYQNNGPSLRDITDVYVTSQITGTGTCYPYSSATTSFYSITDQNNTVHGFVNGTGVTTGQGCTAGTKRVSTIDGQWLLTVTYTNQNCFEEGCITSITETDPAGNVYTSTGTGWTATDANGNQISKSITQNGVNGLYPIKWTDPTGNTPFTLQSSGATADVYTYPLPTGGTANVQVNYLSGYTLQNNFSCPVQGYINSGGFPSSISLADGSSYSFVYESANGTYPSTAITGRIHSITVPAGGTYTYTYSGGTNGIDCSNGLPVILTITGSDGSVWTYNRTPGITTATTVTDPACNDTVYHFKGGLQAEVDSYQGTSGTANCSATAKTLLRTITTCYNGNYTNCASQPASTPVSQVDQYIYLPGISQPSLSETVYNSAELPTQVNEFDFGVNTGSAPTATPLRATKTTYANIGNNILNRPSCVQVTGGWSPSTCGTVTSTTKSITNYLRYSATGNVGTIQNWISGTTYDNHSFSYYTTGLVNTDTDPMGNITTYTYGDCNNSFLTAVAEPLSLSTAMHWDCNGGVPLSITDENTNTTNYSYVDSTGAGDPLWRLRSTTYPDGGKVTTTYNDTASPPNYVTSVLLDSAGDAVQTQVNLDGMNRPYQRITSGSGSGAPIPPTVEVDTTYDAMGRVFTVSNPYTPPASPSGKITYYYDALGRKIEQINQDGTKRWWCFDNTQTGGQPNCNSHKTSAVGDWVDSADENKNEWQTTADGLDRITYVFEPSGGLSSGTYQAPTMETDYQYDGLGNLLSVAQKGRVGTDTARPTRSFIYDGLSRLTSSYNPESGTTTYIYDDVNGKITKTAPAPNAPAGSSTTITATYAYNAFNQIISKSYSDSATTKTPTSCYIYGTPTNYTSGANQKGRLIYEWTQSASAGSCPGALPSTYLTMKYFTYDAMGRPNGTQQQQCSNGTHCVASSPYALSLSYYASGSLNTITNSVGNSGNPLTLTHSYDAGNHLMTLQSNWGGTYPAMLYSLNTASSSYGYNAYGPTNWCMGASCTSNPPLSVTQGYDQYRLWVNNISVIGNVP